MPDDPVTVTPPTCAECRRPWLDPAERWRAFLGIDGKAYLYCPDCAREEFGDV